MRLKSNSEPQRGFVDNAKALTHKTTPPTKVYFFGLVLLEKGIEPSG